MSEQISPPRLAVRLLEWRLPPEIAEAITGDLEDAYKQRRVLGSSRLKANAWFWGQALTLRAGALRRAAKRLEAKRPLHQHNGSGGASDRHPASEFDRPRLRPRAWWSGAGFSLLDVKLGLRMLVKQPGLTAVAVFALAVGIPVGLTPSHAARVFETLPPYPEPHELQVLGSFNVETSRRESPYLYDFVQWREQLNTFEALLTKWVAEVQVTGFQRLRSIQ